jgi:YD repeat-containing protein
MRATLALIAPKVEDESPDWSLDRRGPLAKLRGVMNDRRERPRHLRQGKRLSNGTVVVTEYDASGRLVRETHYTPDMAWVKKILEGESSSKPRPPSCSSRLRRENPAETGLSRPRER